MEGSGFQSSQARKRYFFSKLCKKTNKKHQPCSVKHHHFLTSMFSALELIFIIKDYIKTSLISFLLGCRTLFWQSRVITHHCWRGFNTTASDILVVAVAQIQAHSHHGCSPLLFSEKPTFTKKQLCNPEPHRKVSIDTSLKPQISVFTAYLSGGDLIN